MDADIAREAGGAEWQARCWRVGCQACIRLAACRLAAAARRGALARCGQQDGGAPRRVGAPRRPWADRTARLRRSAAGARHAAAGPAACPLRRQDVRQRTVLRRQGAAHHLHPVSGARLGGAARAQLPSRHRRPGSGHDRRQHVSRRRRPLSRQLVVPHGAERLQTFAELVAGRRPRRPGRRRLQHAQPVERQRRSHLRADHPLLGDRASSTWPPRRSTSSAS